MSCACGPARVWPGCRLQRNVIAEGGWVAAESGPTPTIAAMEIPVIHRPEAGCFEALIEGRLAQLCYRQEGGVLVLHHTEVPPALQGRGIAAALVAATLAHARAERRTVRPVCSYVAAYMQRHPETKDLLA
jgi:uncharacterized protein